MHRDPFLIQLLERGKIPFRKIGAQSRIHYQDVISIQKKINAERSKALDPLADKPRN